MEAWCIDSVVRAPCYKIRYILLQQHYTADNFMAILRDLFKIVYIPLTIAD